MKINHSLSKLMKQLSKYEGKNVLVAYSGGYDSATLLYMLCKVKAVVTAVTVDTGTLPGQEAEQAIRKHQLAWLKKEHKFESVTVSVALDSNHWLLNHGWRFSQMTYWNMLLGLVASKNIDYVLIGNIMGDPEVSLIPELKNAWNARKPFWSGERYPELEFPLAKIHKKEMVELALAMHGTDYRNFIRYSHSCSSPDHFVEDLYLECGSCLKCSSAKHDLYSRYDAILEKSLENLGNVFTDPSEFAIEYGLTITSYKTDNDYQGYTYVIKGSDGKPKVIKAAWLGWYNFFYSLHEEYFPERRSDLMIESVTISYNKETSLFTKSHYHVLEEDVPSEELEVAVIEETKS